MSVDIPRDLFVSSGSVALEVCDVDSCASATEHVGPVPEGPVGRQASVTFDDLGRSFEPGRVSVRVVLSDADGDQVAMARRAVELSRSYPNGRACDGDGHVGGSFALRPADRR